MNYLKSVNWSLVYGCGLYISVIFTGATNGLSAFFIRPRPRLLSTLYDLVQITSINGLLWPFIYMRLCYDWRFPYDI